MPLIPYLMTDTARLSLQACAGGQRSHPSLGQAIVLVASPTAGQQGSDAALLDALRRRLPRYMVPLAVRWRTALPRNPNGKFDRIRLQQKLSESIAWSAEE